MAKTLPLSEVKTRLPELIAGVEEREEEIVVTKNGRPAAILVNVQEYERLKETLDVLSDEALMKQISRSQKNGDREQFVFRNCSLSLFSPLFPLLFSVSPHR